MVSRGRDPDCSVGCWAFVWLYDHLHAISWSNKLLYQCVTNFRMYLISKVPDPYSNRALLIGFSVLSSQRCSLKTSRAIIIPHGHCAILSISSRNSSSYNPGWVQEPNRIRKSVSVVGCCTGGSNLGIVNRGRWLGARRAGACVGACCVGACISACIGWASGPGWPWDTSVILAWSGRYIVKIQNNISVLLRLA